MVSEIWFGGNLIGVLRQLNNPLLYMAYPRDGSVSVPASRSECIDYLIERDKAQYEKRIGDDDGYC